MYSLTSFLLYHRCGLKSESADAMVEIECEPSTRLHVLDQGRCLSKAAIVRKRSCAQFHFNVITIRHYVPREGFGTTKYPNVVIDL